MLTTIKLLPPVGEKCKHDSSTGGRVHYNSLFELCSSSLVTSYLANASKADEKKSGPPEQRQSHHSYPGTATLTALPVGFTSFCFAAANSLPIAAQQCSQKAFLTATERRHSRKLLWEPSRQELERYGPNISNLKHCFNRHKKCKCIYHSNKEKLRWLRTVDSVLSARGKLEGGCLKIHN